MIIDCDSCVVRDLACGECVIGVLLGAPGSGAGGSGSEQPPPGAPILQLDAPEKRALEVLADQGLVPRLRLVAGPPRRMRGRSDPAPPARDVG